jgi:hypothetical protein
MIDSAGRTDEAFGLVASSRLPSGPKHSPGAVDPSTAPGESGKWGHSPLTRWDELPRPKLTVPRICHTGRSN